MWLKELEELKIAYKEFMVSNTTKSGEKLDSSKKSKKK